jgi:hypothetical protein
MIRTNLSELIAQNATEAQMLTHLKTLGQSILAQHCVMHLKVASSYTEFTAQNTFNLLHENCGIVSIMPLRPLISDKKK